MEKLNDVLNKAWIEAFRLKSVYDAVILIMEYQRETVKKLEKMSDTYYKDFLKANDEVHKLQEEIQKELEKKAETDNE